MTRARTLLYVGNFLSAVLNRTYSEELTDRLEARGRTIIRTSSQPNRARRLLEMMQTVWSQRDAYSVAHVDVFSGSAFVWAEAVCLLLRALNKPYVLTLRGGSLPEFAARWPKRVRVLLDSAAVVTAPSPFLIEKMSPYRRDLVLLRNAVDTAAYEFRARATPMPRLVWMRAFHEIYNPLLAVEVLARLSQRWTEATLDMIGPDKDGTLAHVERRANELGLRARVNLVGPISKRNVPRQLASADFFLNTTNVDNTPISVLEAMSAGLCIISTDVGGIPFMLKHEHDAILGPPRDPDAMTAAIEHLLVEPARAERLSRAGHDTAKACDWSEIVCQWEATFEAVAGT